MKKRAASHVDIFSQVQNPEKYAQDFKGLPDLRNTDCAQHTVNKLDQLHQKYKKQKDQDGLLHCKLIAEQALSQTTQQGKIAQQALFAKWLERNK